MELNFINHASIKRKQETSLQKNQKIIYEKNKYLITHLKNILMKPFLIKFITPYPEAIYYNIQTVNEIAKKTLRASWPSKLWNIQFALALTLVLNIYP